MVACIATAHTITAIILVISINNITEIVRHVNQKHALSTTTRASCLRVLLMAPAWQLLRGCRPLLAHDGADARQDLGGKGMH